MSNHNNRAAMRPLFAQVLKKNPKSKGEIYVEQQQ
jgi:hypothetical protein